MERMGRSGIRLVLVLLSAALLLPTVQAATEATITGFEVNGRVDAVGSGKILHLEGSHELVLDLDGRLAAGSHYMQRYHDAAGQRVADYSQCTSHAEGFVMGTAGMGGATYCTERTSLDAAADVQASASAQGMEYFVRIYTLDQDEMDVSTSFSSLSGTHAQRLHASGSDRPDSLEASSAGNPGPSTSQDPRSNDIPFFATRSLDEGSVVVSTQTREGDALTVTGDFVVELFGVAVTVDAQEYETGWKDTALAQGVIEREYHFMRLFMEDAAMQVTSGLGGLVQYATPLHMVSSEADMTLYGVPAGIGIGRPISDDAVVVPGPYTMALDGAADDGMAATIDTNARSASPATAMMSPDQVEAGLWISTGVLFLAAMGWFLIRAHHAPPLPKIEAALEAGRYRKAARLSGRVLRVKPQHESAHLSRAIAWSRMGRQERVVRRLGDFLHRHEPADGTLHYVLGLAHHELGDDTRAKDTMAEAVHRTPSLLGQLDVQLRPDAGSHSHAQAYT